MLTPSNSADSVAASRAAKRLRRLGAATAAEGVALLVRGGRTRSNAKAWCAGVEMALPEAGAAEPMGAIYACIRALAERGEPITVQTVGTHPQLCEVAIPDRLATIERAIADYARGPQAELPGEALRAELAKQREGEAAADEAIEREAIQGELPPEGFADVAEPVADPPDDGDETRQIITPIDRAWAPLPEDLLLRRPPPRQWLLRHPSDDNAPGAGLLARGVAGCLNAAGGGSKSMSQMQLAVSIQTGRPWLGHFEVDPSAVGGRVLLCLGEEDATEIHRRLWAIARELHLPDGECRKVTAGIIALPLAGRPVALVSVGRDGVLHETAALRALRRRLQEDAGDGWALVVLDPLARFADGGVESDNNLATRFVQVVESLTEVPGSPTVMTLHHTSKIARRAGEADSRGVTALTDGFRWQGTLRSQGEAVYFAQKKTNYSKAAPQEIELVRGEGGVLRVPTLAEVTARERQASEAAGEARDARLAEDVSAVLSYLDTLAEPYSGGPDTLATTMGLPRGRCRAAVAHAVATGQVVETGKSRDRRLSPAAAARKGEA